MITGLVVLALVKFLHRAGFAEHFWVQEHFHDIYRCVQRFGDAARANYCGSGEKEELAPIPSISTMEWPSGRSREVAEREVGGCEEKGIWIDQDKGTVFPEWLHQAASV